MKFLIMVMPYCYQTSIYIESIQYPYTNLPRKFIFDIETADSSINSRISTIFARKLKV